MGKEAIHPINEVRARSGWRPTSRTPSRGQLSRIRTARIQTEIRSRGKDTIEGWINWLNRPLDHRVLRRVPIYPDTTYEPEIVPVTIGQSVNQKSEATSK